MYPVRVGQDLGLKLAQLDGVQEYGLVRAGFALRRAILTWMDVDVVQVGWRLRVRESRYGEAHRDLNEPVWNAGWSAERLRQQPVHLVRAPEKPSPHVKFQRVELFHLGVVDVVEAEVDAGSSGKSDEEPDRSFIRVEEGIPNE